MLAIVVFVNGCIPWGRGEPRAEPWDYLAGLGSGGPPVTAVNGDGSSFETAFVVFTELASVHAYEANWIWQWEYDHKLQPTIKPTSTLQRSKAWAKHKTYDIVTLTRPDGTVRTFYFDISHLKLERQR